MKNLSKVNTQSLDNPWQQEAEDLLEALLPTAKEGLTVSDHKRRLHQYGPNQLKKHKKKKLLAIFSDQFKSIIVALLVAAALFAFLLGEYIDGQF